MPSTALKKREYFDEAVQDNTLVVSEAQAWQVRRLSIAMEAEAACHMDGNICDVDFEMFLSDGGKYKVSDFA